MKPISGRWGVERQQEQRMKKERAFTKTVGVTILFTFLFHTIPYTLTTVLSVVEILTGNNGLVSYVGPMVLVFGGINSTVNVFIFISRHKEVRKAIISLVSCCKYN